MTRKEYNELSRLAMDCKDSSDDYMERFMKEKSQVEMSRFLGMSVANESFYEVLMNFLDEYGVEGGEEIG